MCACVNISSTDILLLRTYDRPGSVLRMGMVAEEISSRLVVVDKFRNEERLSPLFFFLVVVVFVSCWCMAMISSNRTPTIHTYLHVIRTNNEL